MVSIFFIHQFRHGTSGNEKVDRYIPLEEDTDGAAHGNWGEVRCESDDRYIFGNRSEKSGITSFEEELLVHESGQAERQEHYDINRMDGLQFYETGSTITPGIKKRSEKLIRFSEDTLKEDTYKKLMEEKPQNEKRMDDQAE